MDGEHRTIGRGQLAAVARAALGPGRRLEHVDRLRGGSKKGVYRLAFDDRSTVVVYVWDEAESYWPATAARAGAPGCHADPFSDASGLDLFQAAHRRPLWRARCGCSTATFPIARVPAGRRGAQPAARPRLPARGMSRSPLANAT